MGRPFYGKKNHTRSNCTQCTLRQAGDMQVIRMPATTSDLPEAAERLGPILHAGRAADDEHGAGGAALQETASIIGS
jgi:hypothetical protein